MAKLPFFVFFKAAIFKSLYIISPSCLVDPMLNVFFEILKIDFSNFSILVENFEDSLLSEDLSSLIPFISISASILINGFSNNS